jgi:hypothetical protein
MRGEEWRVDGWKEEELRKYVLNMEKVGKASHEIRPSDLDAIVSGWLEGSLCSCNLQSLSALGTAGDCTCFAFLGVSTVRQWQPSVGTYLT